MTIYVDGKKVTGRAERQFIENNRDLYPKAFEGYKSVSRPLNKKAVALTVISIVGAIAWLFLFVTGAVLGLDWLILLLLSPIYIFGAYLFLRFIWMSGMLPVIKNIYKFWDKR